MNRWNPLRWLRWLGTGLLSAASPLPWLVDVTAPRFDTLERRVAKLERLQFCGWTKTTDPTGWNFHHSTSLTSG
jgi:hypothetical protein